MLLEQELVVQESIVTCKIFEREMPFLSEGEHLSYGRILIRVSSEPIFDVRTPSHASAVDVLLSADHAKGIVECHEVDEEHEYHDDTVDRILEEAW